MSEYGWFLGDGFDFEGHRLFAGALMQGIIGGPDTILKTCSHRHRKIRPAIECGEAMYAREMLSDPNAVVMVSRPFKRRWWHRAEHPETEGREKR